MKMTSKKHIATLVLALSALLGLASCSGTELQHVEVAPLYKSMARYAAMDSLQRDSLMRADGTAIRDVLSYMGRDDASDSTLVEWAHSPAVAIFTPPTLQVYPSVAPVADELSYIVTNAGTQGLDLPRRHYAAVVWGNIKPIVFTDSCMLIALNHYLGADFEGYAALPDFIRATRTPAMLPYAMAEALVGVQYPYVRTPESTVLSRLVYEGAMAEAKLRLVDGATLAAVLGYDEEQLRTLEARYNELWNQLVAKNMLYTTSEEIADRLVAPAPFTSVLGNDVPGRAGRFIGYCIVSNYLNGNPQTTLAELLSPDFYNNKAILINP